METANLNVNYKPINAPVGVLPVHGASAQCRRLGRVWHKGHEVLHTSGRQVGADVGAGVRCLQRLYWATSLVGELSGKTRHS